MNRADDASADVDTSSEWESSLVKGYCKDPFERLPSSHALTRRRVTSAAEMRALSHPVRLELLELLATHGPLTASEAATLLDQTPANVSWHFRKLAEHGFVRQTRGGGGFAPGRSSRSR